MTKEEKRLYGIAYREKNKERIRLRRTSEEFKAQRRATRNLEKNRISCRKYYAENYETKIKPKHEEYYAKPEVKARVKEHKKVYAQTKGKETKRRYIEELHDTYICNLMCRNTNLRHEDIPQELIDVKRLIIQIKREGK